MQLTSNRLDGSLALFPMQSPVPVHLTLSP